MTEALVILIINTITFLLFGVDKKMAVLHKTRISEKTLLTWAFFMGATGALVGMIVFSHKTLKPKFRFTIPTFIFTNILLLVYFHTNLIK